MDWMTAEKAGELWGITARRVQVLCGSGKIAGAARLGRMWVIPQNAQKPIDGRTKAAKNDIGKKTRDCEGGSTHEKE